MFKTFVLKNIFKLITADDKHRKSKERGFGIGRIEEIPSRGAGLTSTKSEEKSVICQQHQQQHFMKQLSTKTSTRNLNIFSPTSTTHSSNFSSFLHPEEFSYPSFDDILDLDGHSKNQNMGWGQPEKHIKRVRSETDSNLNSGYSASESETDEEMRVHLHNKRSRDVSPVKSTHATTDFSKLASGDCQTLTSESSIRVPELNQNHGCVFGLTTGNN